MQKYPGAFLLVPVLIGIVAADQWDLSILLWLSASAAFLTVGLVATAKRKRGLALLAFGLAMMGVSALNFGLRYSDQSPRHLSKLIEPHERYHVFGTVTDWPVLKTHRTEITVTVDSLIGSKAQFVEGGLLISISDTTTAIQRGDRIEFTSEIYSIRSSKTASGFDYGRFLRLKGISGIAYLTTLLDVRIDRGNRYGLFRIVDKLRQGIIGSFNRNLSPVGAALASGFLIGETRNIPTDVYSMFRGSGTLHLLAVSGSNVALILMMAIVLMWPFSISRTRRAAVLIGVIIIFCILCYSQF